MGLDTRIYCKTRDGEAPLLQDVLPDLTKVDPRFWFPEGATHEYHTHWRYYGERYERGPWPQISAVLSALLAAPNVETVWYTPDCNVGEPGPEPPLTVERLRKLDEYYAARVRA